MGLTQLIMYIAFGLIVIICSYLYYLVQTDTATVETSLVQPMNISSIDEQQISSKLPTERIYDSMIWGVI